jgi:3-oxoacyl-[acyl-carrier protein] reductase
MLVEFMAGADTEESRAALLATIPFARLVEPDEIAAAACWVACDEAAMITGDLIAIDGGRGL